MARNRFTDPLSAAVYDWPINHSEEESFGRARNIEHTAPTSGNGLVRQQGDDPPMTIRLSGTIFHKAQHDAFIGWFALSRTQTIYFKDFTGDEFEVQITAFQPVRKRTLRNPRDFANAPLWYWTYSIEMEIVRFITSAWSATLP